MMYKKLSAFRFQLSGLKKNLIILLIPQTSPLKPPRGFTLLLAVLISGILLALGLAIYNIVSKQVILSSAGRESQFAFFAADTGIECVLYWDSKFDAFSSTSAQAISCGSDRPTTTLRTYLENPSHTMTTTTSTFSFSLAEGIANPCVDIKVVRSENPTRTTVEALGHNTCVISNPRRIERAIRVQY
jgi:Tfp pilus assembly protein PilX